MNKLSTFARRKGSKDKSKRKKRSIGTLLTNPYESIRKQEEDTARLITKKPVKRQVFDPDRQALLGGLGGAVGGALYGGLASVYLASRKFRGKVNKGKLKKLSSRIKSDPIAINKLLGYVGRKARTGAVVGALGYGAYTGVKNYRQSKKANDDYGLTYEYSRGDSTANFARKRGKDKSKRKRRALSTTGNVAAASVGGGLGAVAGVSYINKALESTKTASDLRSKLEQLSDIRFQGKKRQMMSDLRTEVSYVRNKAKGKQNLLTGTSKDIPISFDVESQLQDLAYKRGQKLGKYAVRQNNAVNQIIRKSKAPVRYTYGALGLTIGATAGVGILNAIRSKRRSKK